MDDKARPAAKNGVELVLTGNRETLVAAGLVAREAIAEIPAPRALAHVARERAEIADLRRGDAFRSLGQHCVIAANLRMLAERIQGDESADVGASASRRDLIQSLRGPEIHQDVGRNDAFLDHPEQIAAAAVERGYFAVPAGLPGEVRGMFGIAGVDTGERFQSSAFRIRPRVSRRCFIRW